ncbi:forkhead-associated domain-containing protein 1 isoform X2 [Phaenicophaeus curvirostris]|uniref:forkhead-associated domain-containing protein 1 isoform X2 n=1 Tax=Phaenicophaeus curvirostris TaxID=33595 RepID=UPI0037F0ABC1
MHLMVMSWYPWSRQPSVSTAGEQQVAPVISLQGENVLQVEKEIGHLSGLETESKQKDAMIRDLQDEIAAMAKTLAQAAARNEVELTQKLLTFDRELGAKTEVIKALKEQLSNLQKGSSQVFSHSLYERDLEIGRLRKESEKLKRDHALIAGLVSSLHREIAGKEQKIEQLQQDVEKMKKANREKDNQLAIVSAKCSRIKEETKRELGEQEVIACRNRIGELERDLEGLQGEVQKYCAEQESIQNQLAEKVKLKSFKTQVMQVCSPAAVGAAGKAVTEQQVIEKVKNISEESQKSRERERRLQEELSSKLSKEKEVSESVEVFKKSLCELQACLRSSCSGENLRGELERLEGLCMHPSISAIRVAVVEMAHVPLSWLEGTEQLLASAGMDPSTSSKGLLMALKKLLESSRETTQRNQMLQAQLERVQESQAALLREKLKEMEAKHEQDLQTKINQIILEKDKESQEILQSTLAREQDKYKQSVEEEKKKIQDLESQLRSMTEEVTMKSEEQEVAESKLREAVHNLEEATMREMTLQQQVLMQDEQLKTVQEENEFQRQKLQEEVAEYKEQSKQHSLTIVALEDRLLEAKQQQKTLEEENAALMEKMEGLRRDVHKSTSSTSLEVCPATESHACLWKLREELAAAQRVLLSKEVIIAGLTKELAETRARMSDMRGELSEEQKVELEQNLSRVKCLEREVNLLREKLSQMSSLVEKKDQALQRTSEELRQTQTQCQVLKESSRGTVEKLEDAPGMPVPGDEASKREPMLDLANLGMKCRGLRHEETIQRQKEGLVELRERIKMLEKKQVSVVMEKGSEPLVVLTEDLPEKIVQEMGLKKEPAPMSGTKLKASKVPNGGSHGAADGGDFSEKMYLDVIGALGSLMKVKELSGMQSLKHLPREEREKAGLQRRKDLELLYDKIRNLKRCLERKEEMLKDYEAKVEQLRLSQASLQRCQEEMSKLEDEAYREAEEKVLLKEALERTKLQLSQEKRLLRAAKLHKPGAKKPFCAGKLKAKESTAEAVKMGRT